MVTNPGPWVIPGISGSSSSQNLIHARVLQGACSTCCSQGSWLCRSGFENPTLRSTALKCSSDSPALSHHVVHVIRLRSLRWSPLKEGSVGMKPRSLPVWSVLWENNVVPNPKAAWQWVQPGVLFCHQSATGWALPIHHLVPMGCLQVTANLEESKLSLPWWDNKEEYFTFYLINCPFKFFKMKAEIIE